MGRNPLRQLDGIYTPAKQLVLREWRSHPLRFVILLVAFMVAFSAGSYQLLRNPKISEASSHKFMAFWDGTTPPAGWVCVSCTGGNDFFQVFPRGAATAGGTGGAATHDHSQAFVSHTNGSTITTNRGGQNNFTTDVHAHGYTGDLSGRTATATSLPVYQNLKVIRYDTVGNPPDIPDGVIVMFDADPGTGWTRYAAQDSDMIFGENDATGTGGAADHTHTFSGTLTATADTNGRTGSSTTAATDTHTHTVSGTTATSDHTPLYRDVLLYKNTSGSAKSLVGGEIFMSTGDPGSGWTSLSGASGAFENRFLRGAATYGGTGGIANHTPANDVTTSTGPSATGGTVAGSPPTDFGGAAHTHDVTNSFGIGNNLPPYRDTIIAKKNAPGISIQGTVYMANESTLATSGNGGPCDGSTAVISIRIDGGTAATGSCNSSTATFDIETNLGPSAGQTIAVYLTSTMKANTIYLSDSNADTGIDLYENRLAVGHKNAGPITIVDMTDYDSDQNNTDMLFDAEDAAPDTLIVESGNELHIRTSETFTPGGDVTTPNLHIVGTFSAGSFTHILNGTTGPLVTRTGTLTASTSIFQITSDAAINPVTSGTFTGSNSFNTLRTRAVLTADRTYTMGSGAVNFNGNVEVGNTTGAFELTINLGADLSVVGTLQFFQGNGTGSILDTTTSNHALTVGNTTSAGGTGMVFTANASVVTFTGTSGILFQFGGTFNQGTSEVVVASASGSPSLTPGALTFHKLTINSAATVINQGAGAVTINNVSGAAFTITAGVYNQYGTFTGPGGTNGSLSIASGSKLCVGGTATSSSSTCDDGTTQASNAPLPTFSSYSFNANSTVRYLPNFNTYSVSNTPTYGNLELALKTADAVQTWELGGAMTINGNFTLNPTMCEFCTFDVDANGPITVASGKTTTIDEVGTGNSILDLNPDGTPRNLTTGNVSITSGNQLRVEGTGTSVIDVSGTWTNNGIFGEGNSTVILSGTTSTSFNSGCTDTDTCTAQNFYNLTIDKTDADEANDNVTLTTNGIRLTNLLTITNGELVQGTLNVRAEGTSAVAIAAAGEWNNISTGDLKLGGTFVNEGAAIFNSNNGTLCVNAADDIAISSTSGGSQRAWSGAGTFTLRNLNVTDMTDSSITAYTSAFTNTTWTDGACGTIVSGGCFTDESEGTPCTDDGANAIKIAVNGVLDPASDPEVDGAWSVTVATLSANDILVIFVDGAADAAEATTVVKYDGTGNITNVKLYQSQLVIGTDSGSTNTDQTITVADLDTAGNGYENSDDEDVLYDVTAGADLVVDAEGTHTEQLYIMNGDTFRPASAGGSDTTTHNLEIDTGATITADANNFTIGGSWNNGGTFTAGTGTVAFNTTVTGNTLSGTLNGASGFNNVTFTTSDATATDDWEIQATMSVGNDFTLSAGNIDSNNNSLTVTRDYTLTNATNTDYDAGSSTVTVTRHFNDTGNKYVRGTSLVTLNGSGNFNTTNAFTDLSIGYTSFTTTLNTSNFSYFGTMTLNGGIVSATGGGWIDIRKTASSTPIVFASATSLTGSKSMYHRNEASAITTTIAGGNYGSWNIIMFVTSGSSTSSTYELAGNVTTTGYTTLQATAGAVSNVFNTLNFDINALRFDLGSESRTAAWTVNFGSADFDLTDTAESFGVANNGGSHTFNLSTANIVTDGNIRFTQGTGTISASGTTSTITMTPAAAATRTFYTNAQTIDNFVVNGGAGSIVLLDGDLIPSDNLTITAGTLDVSASNHIITIGGNYSNSGTFDARASTVVFNATDVGNTLAGTMTGSSAFFALMFNGSGGEWTPSAAITVEQSLIMTAGTLLGSQNITVNQDVQGTSGIINLSGGTFEQATNDTSRNFGTTSGSAAWTFSNLTFRDTCSGPCVPGNIVITTQTGGNGGITVAGVLRVGLATDNDQVDLNAGNRTWTLSGTGGDPFLLNTGSDLAPSTSTFSYTGNNGGGDTTVQTETYNILTVNNGSEIYNLEGATVGVDVTVTAGELKLNGQTLTVTNDLTVNGTLSGTTNVTINGSSTGSGTVTLTGGTFEQRVAAAESFGSSSGTNEWRFATLILSNSSGVDRTISPNAGTGTVRADTLLQIGRGTDTNRTTFDNNIANDRILDVNGSVSITALGTLSSSNNQLFTVGDDWTLASGGVFTHNSGTVTFDTTATAVFNGATTFYGFTSTTAAKTLQFTAGQTFTIDTGGLFTITGAADPNEIQIQSTTASQWFINHQGSESVSFAQVINSGCDVSSTDITTTDSVDDGNNGTCWIFGSEFSQEDFRFGQPNGTDIDFTGAPAENAAYTTTGTSDDFRLRMLIHVSGSNLAQNGNVFKLQFGEKTGATCASGVSWGDVATGSGVIRYFDGSPTDGDNLTGNAGDPDHGHTVVDQNYEEVNNFTNSVAAINSGQDGMWDFSLINNSAVGGKRYCFKIVDVTGATDLTAYNQYPEVIVDEELIASLDATSKNFGVIQPGGNPTDVSSTLTTSTNSSTGYVVYAWSTQLMTMGAFTLPDWTGTNAAPTTFGNGSFGFGYTTDDSALVAPGDPDRFTSGGAKYAGFVHAGPGDPVADRTSGPTSGQVDTIGYRIAASGAQEAGTYTTIIVYVWSVTF